MRSTASLNSLQMGTRWNASLPHFILVLCGGQRSLRLKSAATIVLPGSLLRLEQHPSNLVGAQEETGGGIGSLQQNAVKRSAVRRARELHVAVQYSAGSNDAQSQVVGALSQHRV